MTRREKMIAILQKYLPDGFTADTFWIADDIPVSKVDGARKAYAEGVRYEDVLAMTDETIFGGAQRGIVFTEDGGRASPAILRAIRRARAVCMTKRAFWSSFRSWTRRTPTEPTA